MGSKGLNKTTTKMTVIETRDDSLPLLLRQRQHVSRERVGQWGSRGQGVRVHRLRRKLRGHLGRTLTARSSRHPSMKTTSLHHHYHCSAGVSRGWAKASACRFQICLSYAILCQMVPFEYSSSLSLHHFAGLPLDRFPS